MISLLFRKFSEMLMLLLFITFISFLILRLAPGDPVLQLLKVDELAVSQEQLEALREDMGFNEPLLVQYGQWLLNFIRLDFGESYATGQPVMEMILTGLPATLELTFSSLLVMLLLSIPLGSLAALYRNSWLDHASRALSILGAAIPSFWLGLLLVDLFGVRLGWLPTMGRDGFTSLLLPSFTLGIAMSGVYVRLLRSSLLDSLSREFITAARSRGLSPSRVFVVHALRHSLPPVITVFGVSLGGLIGGVVVIEVIFAYPGIGKLALDAIKQRDYPLIQGYILVMGIVVFIVNTAVDLSYRFLNPELTSKLTLKAKDISP
ncbi:ABC transporter permease [Paenibacillus sp. F411]|uniref:Nickel import system permease protein NikB n=1 Tax=Paenibacillus algicola TaxID=2565926 RepID=A0A4V1G4I8_9BACL|nr:MULTISPECIES: nickel ABC transporter permease [Paenibacillus]MBO2944527.1 ABC transporter permease [Paenibacillus sp. F411]QCT04844.1 nickel ABC transporter permease [Paenibacillus algicola]